MVGRLAASRRLTRFAQQALRRGGRLWRQRGGWPCAPPIVTMLSYAIVFRHGLEQYVADAKAAGVAGAIVPDLPVEEAGPLAAICRREDFSLIQLITPTTPRDRARRIAEQLDRIYLLRFGHRHHGRADRLAAGDRRQRGLAARADAAADLHRLRHQPAGARADAGSRGRWSDCRLGHRPPHGRSGHEAARTSAG